MNVDLKALLDRQIAELERKIEALIAHDTAIAETAAILRPIPGIGPVASTMLIAEMPELGQVNGEQAAALAGLAPIAHDSGTLRGKRTIGGGRLALRHVMFQAALVAAQSQPGSENLRGPPPKSRKTAQGDHHRRGSQAPHGGQRAVQISLHLDRFTRLIDTVARKG